MLEQNQKLCKFPSVKNDSYKNNSCFISVR